MTLWGGRFGSDPAELLWRFTVDPSDRRLLADDIRGSLAHVAMLAEQSIIAEAEAATIVAALGDILEEAKRDEFEFRDGDEDIHTAVERRLVEMVGDVGKKLHTGRSRNDQVALDLRLYLARAGRQQVMRLAHLASVLVDKAEQAGATLVPSYTHLQQAQAIPLAHHFLAYAEMLRRDADRFRSAVGRIEISPLGAGASGGSSLPIDPAASARHLGWRWHFVNSLDAVAARDFVAEYAFVAAQAMAHLSRLAEELILWSTSEFGWVTFEDAFTTGSSALPQKKNPDIAELVRGRSAVVIGDVMALLALQKGVPLAYNRDFQEDKRAVFHADDVLAGSLEALAGMLAGARFDPPAPSAWVTALDLAEALVERGVPFREAHAVVGRLVTRLVDEGRELDGARFEDLAAVDGRFLPDDVERLDPTGSVAARRSPGGGSFAEVGKQIAWHRQAISEALADL